MLVHPAAWNAMVDYITWLEQGQRSLMPRSSSDISAKMGPHGTTWALKRRSGGIGTILNGAFYTRYKDADGHTMLQCGTVTGDNGGSESIADYKVVDADTGTVGSAGDILYIVANCTATIEDGLMLPGCLLNTASLDIAATVPDNHSFTVDDDTGDIYVEVGRWTDTVFLPSSAPGHYTAAGTLGNFLLTKSA